jgi:hypothetical protein
MVSRASRSRSISESVRRLRWRCLVVAGAGAAVLAAIGSSGALAHDPGGVDQSRSSTSTAVVDRGGRSSGGLVEGPFVAPVTVGLQTIAAEPSAAGPGAGPVSQSSADTSEAFVDDQVARSTGLVSGPITAPVASGLGTGRSLAGAVGGVTAPATPDLTA